MAVKPDRRISERLEELCLLFTDDKKSSINIDTPERMRKYIDYLISCATYEVFDIEATELENEHLRAILDEEEYDHSNSLRKKVKLSDKDDHYLNELSKDWPAYLQGLTDIYRKYATLSKNPKDNSLIPNPLQYYSSHKKLLEIKVTPEEFISLLITCTQAILHEQESTTRKNKYLNKLKQDKEA